MSSTQGKPATNAPQSESKSIEMTTMSKSAIGEPAINGKSETTKSGKPAADGKSNGKSTTGQPPNTANTMVDKDGASLHPYFLYLGGFP